MFKKKNKQISEEAETTAVSARTEKEQPQEFQKNIKTMWIYTSLFCIFALVLIFISSFFQEKNDRENEDLRAQVEKHELVLSTNQSTLQNIESENKTYKQINDILDKRNEYLEEQYSIDKDLLLSSAEIIANADYLLDVQAAIDAKDLDTARTTLACIDVNYLTPTMRATYDKFVTELAAE